MSRKKIEPLETPDFRLTTEEERTLGDTEGENRYLLMKLWFREMVKASDPKGHYPSEVGLTATKLKMGIYSQKGKAEIADFVIQGKVNESFLAQVKKLLDHWQEISPEAAYLNSLKVFYLSNQRWPSISELDKAAFDDHPEAFPSVTARSQDEQLSPDERKMFRRLRKKLGIDWLPEGKRGPKK